MAAGLDVGTGFLVSAKQDANNQINIKSIRDAFLDIDSEEGVKKLLKLSKIDFIESDDKLYILGENATVMASLLKKEIRHPMSKGVLAPGELEAEKIILLLIENILGRATTPDEVCYYSVPAAPIDRDIDIIYHQAMFSKIVSSLGYRPIAMNEGAAIIYSNCAKEDFSGVAISMGAGMCNVCLSYKAMNMMSYSITNSGDWLDECVSKAVNIPIVRAQATKEKGIDLLDPSAGDPRSIRVREAFTVYYKSLALRVLDSIKSEFIKKQSTIELPVGIPIVISGGTSLAKNFLEFFKAAFDTVKDKMPFVVSEVRMASSPLNAVAQGLLVAALNHESK